MNDFARAFSSPARSPLLSTAITGARGTGKTAMLSVAAREAESHGWIVARTVAMEGMLEDILIAARKAAVHLVDSLPSPRIAGLTVGSIGGVTIERSEELSNWRHDMAALLDELDRVGVGLLITVDEVQPQLEEMIRLAATYQLFVTEGRKVALLMAGLPHNILRLEQDKTVSFLRRAKKLQLGSIPDYEVQSAMLHTIEGAGRSIETPALEAAVKASGGFPFMMQLVGFRMWDCHPDSETITEDDAHTGIAQARAELRERIVSITYDGLSTGDKAFLAALASFDEAPSVADIARTMNKAHSYATQYKNRLLGQGIIAVDSAGKVRFDLPLMREYVVEAAGD